MIYLVLALGWEAASIFRKGVIKNMRRNIVDGNSFAFLCDNIDELEHSVQENLPRVSVVMPLKGFGKHNLQNWRTQITSLYGGPLEFLFIVESKYDPAYHVVSRLITEYKDNLEAKVVVAGLSTTCSQKIHNQLTWHFNGRVAYSLTNNNILHIHYRADVPSFHTKFSERRYEQALEIFSWMESCSSLRLSSWDHAARLDLIAKAYSTSQAEEYYNKLQSPATRQAASFPLLHCYVMERDVQKAETFMAQLQSHGLPVDPHSFNEIMNLYVATLFQVMLNDETVKVGWSTYCTLANIFRKNGLNTEAQACLVKAEAKLSPTGRLGYSFVMTCYAALNDSDGVMRMWEASKSVPGRILTAYYMAAMSCSIKVGDISQAECIFGKWEAGCRKHDVRVSNVLLGAYVRNRWIEKAERLHLHMLEKGACPNYKTWEILMEGYVQSRQMDKAVGCMKKGLSLLKSCHWRPPVELMEAIGKHFEEQGSADDAYRYIKVL
ncbi:Pentatricopeptide repeat-containing protein [Zea mays]|uniref:Pentatricopeptide repeat-containing protein n=1 Tax=Zea mays TaxID=4577 RepID=A0A1D6FXP1_MAIZE|nr:Pentatricopeptide repeat-containing protein [Zea mays]